MTSSSKCALGLLTAALLLANASAAAADPPVASDGRLLQVQTPPTETLPLVSLDDPTRPTRMKQPPPPPPPRQTLSVFTTNTANAVNVNGLEWWDRMDRLASEISRAGGPPPDVISLTETAGLWHCFRGANDYDVLDRLMFRLRTGTGIEYRIAYMVGNDGVVKNQAGFGTCWYFSGDAVLYNPARLTNLNPADLALQPQFRHNANVAGRVVRRSLPLCQRSTTFQPLERLIDGGPQIDRCNTPTPSGPAWTQVDVNGGGDYAPVASLARFAFNGVPNSSFDVVTTHPQSGEESLHEEPISQFVEAVTTAPLRTAQPYIPVLVVGDFNGLADQAWPRGTTQVARISGDVMAASVGTTAGLAPQRGLALASSTAVPGEPCGRGSDPADFSDHCGLLVRFSLR